MKFTKLSGILFTATTFFLTACQAPSNTLTFTPQAPTMGFNTQNQSAIVSVFTKDERVQPEVSSYVRKAEVFKLNANPSVDQLFQQVFQQDLNSKGFRLTHGNNNANSSVFVSVKEFYAKVDQGDLRYNINARIQLQVHVQNAKGTFTKNLGASRNQEGAFNAGNDEIKKVLDLAFKDVVSAVYADQEIANAIRQGAN
ncbi:MAG: YajG family lipoprotein [Lonepinella koalarum]|nr:YajG family lipoprotein [Lonepinella koalarum]